MLQKNAATSIQVSINNRQLVWKPDIVLITERNVVRRTKRGRLQKILPPTQSLIVDDEPNRNRARLANCAKISAVRSVDASSQTTTSSGNRTCSLRVRSCSSRSRSPLYVAIAIDITLRSAFTLSSKIRASYSAAPSASCLTR